MPPLSTAVVFPGQGTQRPGMGRDFHDTFAVARRAYREASDAVGIDPAALCFHDDERLRLTEYAQPAILAAEIAMLRAAESELGLVASHWGGHSLGEYTALVAAGVLPLSEASRIVRERGRLMQHAVPIGRGRMVAVLGERVDADAIARVLDGLEVAIANLNSEGQVVLSGEASDTHLAEQRIRDLAHHPPVRFVELDVSAPFHSPLMATIEPAFEQVLRSVLPRIVPSRATCVTSNTTGGFHDADPTGIVDRLVRQIGRPVRWRSNMQHLLALCARVIEIGPGRPLSAFFKTLGANIASITSVRSAARVLDTKGTA